MALSCPRCGDPVAHVADGVPDGFTSQAIVRCRPCRRTFRLTATLTDDKAERLTETALERYHQEVPCPG